MICLQQRNVIEANVEVFLFTIFDLRIYDPVSGTFTPTGDIRAPRFNHTATLLPDGRVLIAGGSAVPRADLPTNGAEIYDPSTGTFAATGNMIFGHVCQQATLLGNGKVLILGGALALTIEFRLPNSMIPLPAHSLLRDHTPAMSLASTVARVPYRQCSPTEES